MAEPRDEAVTAYVRMRIREWEASGRDQLELARRVGVSPATISQVKTRLGVGSRSIDGFARAFGLANVPALRSAAYEWYLAHGGTAERLLEEPAVQSAIRTVLSMRPDVSETQIRTILFAFGNERFMGRDDEFWVPALLEELKQERAVAQQAHAATKAAQRDERSRKANLQSEMRAGHRRRKEAQAAPQPEATPRKRAGAKD